MNQNLVWEVPWRVLKKEKELSEEEKAKNEENADKEDSSTKSEENEDEDEEDDDEDEDDDEIDGIKVKKINIDQLKKKIPEYETIYELKEDVKVNKYKISIE